MSWTFCTSGAAISKAGANVNSTIKASGATLADWSDEIENQICNEARVDLVTNFGSLTSNGKQILHQIASAAVAQRMVAYDINSYPSVSEAETILDLLEDQRAEGLKQIKDDKIKTYLGAT